MGALLTHQDSSADQAILKGGEIALCLDPDRKILELSRHVNIDLDMVKLLGGGGKLAAHRLDEERNSGIDAALAIIG
ncbi:hypothetical protein D9M68_658970 [compost metagenome]